jgi:cytolysin (calcineurin-like family phosphatase)
MKKLLIGTALISLFITAHGFPPSCSEIIGSVHAQEVAAVAQTATQTDLGAALKGLLNDTVIPLVISLVGALVSLALLKLKNKFSLELKAETESWIRSQAENAVQMVAEKAAASEKLSGLKVGSNDKLNQAIAWLVTKVPALTNDQADAYIHAAIARIPGVGSTGDQSLTPSS